MTEQKNSPSILVLGEQGLTKELYIQQVPNAQLYLLLPEELLELIAIPTHIYKYQIQHSKVNNKLYIYHKPIFLRGLQSLRLKHRPNKQ